MQLRPAMRDDLPYLKRLRNDPATRTSSRRQHEFSDAEVEDWAFGSGRQFYVAEKNGYTIGCASLEAIEKGHEISIVLDPLCRGLGLGSVLARAASDLVSGPILAQIRRQNTRSIAAFRSAGYRPLRQDVDYIFLGLGDVAALGADIEAERAAFEATIGQGTPLGWLYRDREVPDEYDNPSVQLAWRSWLARARLATRSDPQSIADPSSPASSDTGGAALA